jgi:hypothetical protein
MKALFNHPVARFISKNIATIIATFALLISLWAIKIQISQSRAELWHNLRHEFDRELIKQRKACGEAYFKNNLESKYGQVMDFFDVVAFLVHSHRMDKDLFHYTFSYYFYPYYQASQKFIEEERNKDPEVYQDIFEMFKEIPPDPSFKTKRDLNEFFQSEKNLEE